MGSDAKTRDQRLSNTTQFTAVNETPDVSTPCHGAIKNVVVYNLHCAVVSQGGHVCANAHSGRWSWPTFSALVRAVLYPNPYNMSTTGF